MGQGEFSVGTARVRPAPAPSLSSATKFDRVLRATREDYAEIWRLTDMARALRLVHPSWIAEKAAGHGRPSGIGYKQKQRLMQRYLEGRTGVSAPFITRRWAQELKSALVSSGIAERGFPIEDLLALQQKLGFDPAVEDGPTEAPPALPPPPSPPPVQTDGLAGQIQQLMHGGQAERYARQLTEIYGGLYDVVAREQNDGSRDPNGGRGTRSLLVVHAQQTAHGVQHVACELVPYLAPGAVARSFLVRTGYAFRLADACVVLLFDTPEMPPFLATEDGKAFNVVAPGAGARGMKTLFLSAIAPGSQLLKISHQTAANAGVAVARRREGVVDQGRMRLSREDLRALRRFPMAEGSADPAENELIHAARQFPMLHTTLEAAPAFPLVAGLRR
jgi:hypothetical protein